jgi:hypothetical protein
VKSPERQITEEHSENDQSEGAESLTQYTKHKAAMKNKKYFSDRKDNFCERLKNQVNPLSPILIERVLLPKRILQRRGLNACPKVQRLRPLPLQSPLQ